MKRIAVIGSGISGLATAYFLAGRYDVTLFEKENYLGGHTNTVQVPVTGGQTVSVDTGFIVFNDRTYPGFIRLLQHLGVASHDTTMSFSVQCRKTGLEYCGSSLNGLFADRRNLLRPGFYRFLNDFFRFGRQASEVLGGMDRDLTVGQFFEKHRYGQMFYQKYFLPMGAAIWSCPTGLFQSFPIRFIVRFYHHHGLLGVRNRPQWKVVSGGSQSYVREIRQRYNGKWQTCRKITRVRRLDDGQIQVVGLDTSGLQFEAEFDHAVLACHADQALSLVQPEASSIEQRLLQQFPYQSNVAILHTEPAVMPRRQQAWASWNYCLPAEATGVATLTYDMNRLQGLSTQETGGQQFFVTLNDRSGIPEEKILRECSYSHPVFGMGMEQAQSEHHRLIDHRGLSYCGAYWGSGFHEDGLQSALRVSERLLGEDPWRVVSTPGGLRISDSAQSSTDSVTVCS